MNPLYPLGPFEPLVLIARQSLNNLFLVPVTFILSSTGSPTNCQIYSSWSSPKATVTWRKLYQQKYVHVFTAVGLSICISANPHTSWLLWLSCADSKKKLNKRPDSSDGLWNIQSLYKKLLSPGYWTSIHISSKVRLSTHCRPTGTSLWSRFTDLRWLVLLPHR